MSTVVSKIFPVPSRAGFARGFGNNGHQRGRRNLGSGRRVLRKVGGAGRGKREMDKAGGRWTRHGELGEAVAEVAPWLSHCGDSSSGPRQWGAGLG